MSRTIDELVTRVRELRDVRDAAMRQKVEMGSAAALAANALRTAEEDLERAHVELRLVAEGRM